MMLQVSHKHITAALPGPVFLFVLETKTHMIFIILLTKEHVPW